MLLLLVLATKDVEIWEHEQPDYEDIAFMGPLMPSFRQGLLEYAEPEGQETYEAIKEVLEANKIPEWGMLLHELVLPLNKSYEATTKTKKEKRNTQHKTQQ